MGVYTFRRLDESAANVIRELFVSIFVSTSKQGKGEGTLFVGEIEKACKELGLTHIFPLTKSNVAFAREVL